MAQQYQSTWQKLLSDKQFLHRLKIREAVIDAIRHYFKSRHFTEVSTPLLVRSPGTEPFLEVFETSLKSPGRSDQRGFLITSPEYALKKLIAGGLGSCFEITKSFRNDEGISSSHNHEFTILEWYHVEGDYTDVMSDFEALMLAILRQLSSQPEDTTLTYRGKSYDVSAPWERLSVAEAFQKYAGLSESELLDEKRLVEITRAQGLTDEERVTWEEAFHLLLLNKIEPHLGQKKPTILYDYPASLAALAKRKNTDPRFAERFEVYLAGLELGNAFSELLDSSEQRTRFETELSERKRLGKTPYELDEDYLAALESGLPPTGGIAVGVDRLVMLFADTANIKDILLFPVEELFFV